MHNLIKTGNDANYRGFSIQYFIFSIFLIIIISCSSKAPDEFVVVNKVQVREFNKTLADQGMKIFKEKCAACHKYDTKLVGPPLRDVVKRRTPEYILSQILHPDQMIAKNDTVKALLAIYLTQMPNQHLNDMEARAVFEHLRDVAQGGGN